MQNEANSGQFESLEQSFRLYKPALRLNPLEKIEKRYINTRYDLGCLIDGSIFWQKYSRPLSWGKMEMILSFLFLKL